MKGSNQGSYPGLAHPPYVWNVQYQPGTLRAVARIAGREFSDERKTAGTDLTVLRMWLDQAWSLRSQEKYDDVHTVTDRCRAQADMIREKITASKLAAQADQKEADVARARATLEKTKKALENAKVQKIRLEAKS